MNHKWRLQQRGHDGGWLPTGVDAGQVEIDRHLAIIAAAARAARGGAADIAMQILDWGRSKVSRFVDAGTVETILQLYSGATRRIQGASDGE